SAALTGSSSVSSPSALSCIDGPGDGGAEDLTISLTSGTTYYVRVYDFEASGTAFPATLTFNIGVNGPPATPATPGAIAGTATQCPALTGQTYSIAAVTNATTYTWTVPTGWTITAGAGTTSITVTTGTAGQNGNITVTAGNSCGTSAAATYAVTINPAVTISSFSPATSTRCQGAGSVTTTTTASNSTGITYSIDATSIAGGVTIVAGTGAVTYPAGWIGTTTITASAAGCNGPVTTTHAVTTTPTVTINAFAPATSTRCQGAGTVTTTTTASNSTGITYSIDATSIAGGVTIVAGTGAVTYPAGWSGTTTITASAAGCNGPATTTHVVTINPLPSAAGTISGTASVCKNQVGYVYTISAIPNATSYVWAYSGSNATITNNGTSATIDFGNSTSGNLTVYGTNSCGNGVSA
ncbi:MAG: hypothetical protein ACK44B_11460, partial [Flavobacteriales bacterium]